MSISPKHRSRRSSVPKECVRLRARLGASTFLVLLSFAEGLQVVIMDAFARARRLIAS